MSLDVAYLALGELENLLKQYDEKLRAIEEAWRAFVDSATKAKASWDADLPKVKIRVDQLRNVVEGLKKEVEILLAKKELGLISERDYAALSEELRKKIDELEKRLEEFMEKIAEVEGRVRYLWARALTREYLSKFDLVELEKRIEDAKAAGKIDDETYARMKQELAVMKSAWEFLNLL